MGLKVGAGVGHGPDLFSKNTSTAHTQTAGTMFGGGFFGMQMPGGVFEAHYRAMPVAFIDKQAAEYGDKVILPPSALDRLGAL